MKKNTRLTAALLALVMIIAMFAGCKKNGGDDIDDPDDGKVDITKEYVYIPETTALPEEIQYMDYTSFYGDKLAFSSYVEVWPDGRLVTQEERNEYYEIANEYYTEAYKKVDSGEMTYEQVEEGAPEPGFTGETRLYTVNTDGTNLTQLPDYKAPEVPEGDYSHAGIQRMFVGDDGSLYILEYSYQTNFELPADFNEETDDIWTYYVGETNSFTLKKLSETGAELSSIQLNDFAENAEGSYFYVYYIYVDKQGSAYFDDGGQNIFIIDSQGALNTKIPLENTWIQSYLSLSDGEIGVITNDNETGKTVIRPIDVANKTLGEGMPCPMNAYNLTTGRSAFDFCYNSGNNFYGYDMGTGVETKLITWLNNNIDGNNISACELQENGDILIVTYNYDNEVSNTSSYELVRLKKTPASEAPQKEVITLACFGLDYQLRSKILSFNKANESFRIEVVDYSDYNTEDDYNAGLTKLNTEIVSGNVPDILATANLPVQQYAAKGLLIDLYPFIDSDSEISRDDLVESVFKAMESDGKLITIAGAFSVTTMAGKASVIGSDTKWTMTELKELVESKPDADYPLGQYMTRETVFSQLLRYNMESYVDWSTGECSFDSEEFKSLLEFAMRFPESEYGFGMASGSDVIYRDMAMATAMPEIDVPYEDENTLLAEGRMLATTFYLYDFYEFQYRNAYFGGDLVFKGMPTEEGGSVAEISNALAMTSSCKNKEGAWAFMRELLTEKYQETLWQLPTNKNVLEERFKVAMTQEYDDEGNPIPAGSVWLGEGEEYNYYAMTEEEANKLRNLIDSVNYLATIDNSLVDIVIEEAGAFFAGEKSVDEAASLIQSRMKIYVNEQR